MRFIQISERAGRRQGGLSSASSELTRDLHPVSPPRDARLTDVNKLRWNGVVEGIKVIRLLPRFSQAKKVQLKVEEEILDEMPLTSERADV